MNRRRTSRLAAVTAFLAVAAGMSAPPAGAAAANVTVDFTTVERPVSPQSFGLDVTGYGYGHYVTNDTREQAMVQGRFGTMRMGLKYAVPHDPASAIVANGAGADTVVTGDQWVSAIKARGAEPVVIVPEDAVDAANMVRHFNTGSAPNRVTRWIVGNEPGDITAYATRFNAAYDAMKAVDPAIKVGGPALAHPAMGDIRTFLKTSGTRTDFVDFHKYGEGREPGKPGGKLVCDSQLLAETVEWENDVNQVRSIIQEEAPARAGKIDIQVGEINSSWSVDNDPPELAQCGNIGTEPFQYRNAAIWWAASVWGHLLKAGAQGFVYGDKNGALGLLYDQPNDERPAYARNGAGLDERMPIYQGVGFFTGQQDTSLARFGSSLVRAQTTLAGVEVYASANPKVVVLVNKSTTPVTAVVGVGTGVTKAAAVQKSGGTASYQLPASLGTLPVSQGTVTVSLPGPSLTQLAIS
ncbi:GH39 family glycosyl hydrolase [Streptosporangium sp. CA-135522]|uniref:GH39 family glycosyl hydrolase n=1 Tax=Streptosporangium sp. CA-135522 TaxID=3240072 RepID=UPI003D8DCB97